MPLQRACINGGIRADLTFERLLAFGKKSLSSLTFSTRMQLEIVIMVVQMLVDLDPFLSGKITVWTFKWILITASYVKISYLLSFKR